MDAADILNAINQLAQTKIHYLMMSFLFTTTIFMLLKTVAEAISGFIQFRLDKHLSIGSPVEVYGHRGRIKEISVFTITIKIANGYIRIPTKSWRTSKYIVIREPDLEDINEG